MKKLGLFTMLGILIGISACTGLSEIENPEENLVRQEVTITAGHEFDGETRTVLQEDGSVWWKPNDAIGVFFGTYCSWFRAYNMEDAPTANFIGEAIIIQGHTENSSGNAGTYTYWGVFPPDLTNDDTEDDDDFSYWSGNEDYEEPTRDKESVNVYLPAKQKGVAGTFDSNNFISIARNTTYKELYFYNLCGGLAFCVEKEGIHTVIFKGNAEEDLAGYVNVVMNSEGRPVVNEVKNGKKEVKLTMPEGEYFVPGEWYYIVMLPASLEKGYSMTFYTDKEVGTKTSSKPVEVKRSVFGKLTNPDAGVEYTNFVPAQYVEIDYNSSEISVGDTLSLKAVITPSDCTFPAEWSSSNPSVATVDENGNVIGVSRGETRITLTVGDLSDYIWLYVYERGVVEPEIPVPSLTIKSLDLTGIYAIASIYDERYGTEILYTISENGETKPLRFDVESDNKEFEKFVEDSTGIICTYNRAGMLTDKYLTLYIDEFYPERDIPYHYIRALESATGDVAIRMSDYSVIESDFIYYDESLKYQNVYYKTRVSYDGKSIYMSNDGRGGFYVANEENGKLTKTNINRYDGSQFDPNTSHVLLDKNNNLLTHYSGGGYVLCSDNSIIPFTTPENSEEDYELGTFFEKDYTWYYLSGTHVRIENSDDYWDYIDRNYSRLYKVSIEDNEVIFTELTSAYRDEDWYWDDDFYRRGSTFMFGRDGNYVVIDMENLKVSYSSVENYSYTSSITPDGYYTDLQNGVLYKYDILSDEPTLIETDRSMVPPMTPTEPRYDSTNHRYYESGTRLSDSATITVVTDAETGKVTVYEGGYDSPLYVVLR